MFVRPIVGTIPDSRANEPHGKAAGAVFGAVVLLGRCWSAARLGWGALMYFGARSGG